jgi:hypothetical protein
MSTVQTSSIHQRMALSLENATRNFNRNKSEINNFFLHSNFDMFRELHKIGISTPLNFKITFSTETYKITKE